LTPKPLWHEQSANQWWRATVNALQDALQQIDPNRLRGICFAHQRETFVPVDENGTPLRNAILWMDERAGDQLDHISETFGKERFHELTGKPISGNLSVAKIAWIQENEPEIFQKTRKFLDVHAFLVYYLTGDFSTGWGCVDPMGMFDMNQDQWAFELLRSINISADQLPNAFAPGQIIGEISLKASRECGLPAGLPVVAGLGDGQSAGLGSKVINSKTAYLSLGTSVVSGYFASSYQISDKFRTMYGGVENTYFLETVILSGTYTISWFLEKILRENNRATTKILEENLEKVAKEIPAGSQGLLLVPYWNSAMNPYWDTKASGIMVGLRGFHGSGHIYRAILEGIAFEQRLHTTDVESVLGNEVENFVVTGGGAKNDLWCQIIADVTGKPVQRTTQSEATALGAGILAVSTTDSYIDHREAAQAMVHLEDDVFEPDNKRHQHYSRLYEDIYRHIFPALRKLLQNLSDSNQH